MSSKFPQGAVLKLRLRLSRSSDLIEARAEVRYCLRRVGVGARFIEIALEAMRTIENEISSGA